MEILWRIVDPRSPITDHQKKKESQTHRLFPDSDSKKPWIPSPQLASSSCLPLELAVSSPALSRRRLKKTRSRNSWEGSLWREKHRWQRIHRKPGYRLRKKKNGKTARKKWRSTQILSTQIVKNGHRQGPKRRHRPLPRCRIAVSFTSVTLAACSLLICWSVYPLILK